MCFGEITEDRPVSVEREVFPGLLENGHKVAVYKGCKYWMDIGTPEKYMQTHDDIMSGECRISDIQFNSRHIFIEGGVPNRRHCKNPRPRVYR